MADRQATHPAIAIDEPLWVVRARHDRDAFAPLYLAYFDRVHAYCYRRLGNAEDAADATSTVFSRALGAIDTCNETSFRSWLFAIAHNVLTDLYRSRHPEHRLDDAFEVPGREPSPEEAALARETEHTVSTLLAQLAPDQRSVVELRLAGLTSKEIGAILNKHPNAVDQAQFRAIQRLRSLVAAGQPFLEGLR